MYTTHTASTRKMHVITGGKQERKKIKELGWGAIEKKRKAGKEEEEREEGDQFNGNADGYIN